MWEWKKGNEKEKWMEVLGKGNENKEKVKKFEMEDEEWEEGLDKRWKR